MAPFEGARGALFITAPRRSETDSAPFPSVATEPGAGQLLVLEIEVVQLEVAEPEVVELEVVQFEGVELTVFELEVVETGAGATAVARLPQR